jgi:PBSX family phage terminase large subunit
MKLLDVYKKLFVRPPLTRYFILSGGRGSGKSFHNSIYLLNLTYEKNQVILYTRWTMVSAHLSIIPEFLEKIELLNLSDDFEIKQTEILNKKTGSSILFRGIKTSQGTATANLKSINGVTCWVLDEAEELHDKDTFDRIDLSIRDKKSPNQVILILNPSFKTHWIYNYFFKEKRQDTTYIHTNYLDNIDNLSESFISTAENIKSQNIERFNHLFLGTWIDNAEGLLWNVNIINNSRVTEKPENLKTIISIDPATTSTTTSDETGIIVLGYSENKHFYILEDLSGVYTPNEWAKVCTDAFIRYNCFCYVAEKNQGGEMVGAILRQFDKRNMINLVQATKGKFIRAEPVYSLYEQNLVHHVNNLPLLERQMVTFNPNENKQSPDRVDALVWGITYLSGKIRTGLSKFG